MHAWIRVNNGRFLSKKMPENDIMPQETYLVFSQIVRNQIRFLERKASIPLNVSRQLEQSEQSEQSTKVSRGNFNQFLFNLS